MPVGVAQLIEFQAAAEAAGVQVPEAITRGLGLIDAAEAYGKQPPAEHLLNAKPAQIPKLVDAFAVRQHVTGHPFEKTGLRPGVDRLVDGLLVEIEQAVRPELDGMVESLRPRFDTAVAPFITGAQQYKFTYQTTSDDVILLADEAASACWRDIRTASRQVDELVSFRRLLSETWGVSPTVAEITDLRESATRMVEVVPMELDDSVSYAAGDWSYDGSFSVGHDPRRGVDWLGLAAHGLRLNTPSEVKAKLKKRKEQALEHMIADAMDTVTPTPAAVKAESPYGPAVGPGGY